MIKTKKCIYFLNSNDPKVKNQHNQRFKHGVNMKETFFSQKHSHDGMMETTKSFIILESTRSEYLIEISKTVHVMNFS